MASPVRAEYLPHGASKASCRSGSTRPIGPRQWLKSKNPRLLKPCDVSAGNGQISVCAVLARTHFFDAIETILQRSNGDHEIAAAFQIIRIRAWTVHQQLLEHTNADEQLDRLEVVSNWMHLHLGPWP
jgi:hypothetical protein